MLVDGAPYRTIWRNAEAWSVSVIDQRRLPHRFELVELSSLTDVVSAIRTMVVRGAPLIGATAAYGVALALRQDPSDSGLETACGRLVAARPTAVNLAWAARRVASAVAPLPAARRAEAAFAEAATICEEDVGACAAIGRHGAALLAGLGDGRRPLNLLTHCNAGWLATVDFGTALAPIYRLHDDGVPVHVWVDETRPRNQGAALTAWELRGHGVPHTLIADNAGGHLMREGLVDACIVGADRVAANGDVCNKIGTYLKALAAVDTQTPFYAALPLSTIDWSLEDGSTIPIETRDAGEVTHISGMADDGEVRSVRIAPAGTRGANYAFDVTPARLVSALITERGVAPATGAGLSALREKGEAPC